MGTQAALAATWTKISLPHVSDRPDDPDLDSTAPYTLKWPGEGTTNSGNDDCDTTLPYRKGRRARSNYLSGVKGIQKRGRFFKSGTFTSDDGGNHLAFFFHVNQCYGSGSEYGFTRKLNQGVPTLYLFQCWNCNTPSEKYTKKAVYSFPGQERVFRLQLQTDGDFVVRVYVVQSNGSLLQVHYAFVYKASWLPNLYGANGYITANAHVGNADSQDSYGGSYNQVTTVRYFH